MKLCCEQTADLPQLMAAQPILGGSRIPPSPWCKGGRTLLRIPQEQPRAGARTSRAPPESQGEASRCQQGLVPNGSCVSKLATKARPGLPQLGHGHTSLPHGAVEQHYSTLSTSSTRKPLPPPFPSLCSLSKAKTNRSLCAPRASMSGQLWAQLCLWLSGARMSVEHQELAGNQSVHHKPVALGSPHSSPGSDRAVASQAVTARAMALNVRGTNPPEPQVPRAPGLVPSLPAHSWEEASAAASVSWLQKGIKSSTPRPRFHLELNISCYHFFFFFPSPDLMFFK